MLTGPRASRRLLLGSLKKLQVDDGLMIFAMVWRRSDHPRHLHIRTIYYINPIQITDTVLVAAMNVVSRTNSNLIDPNQPITLTPDVISERVLGSKMVLLVEQMQIVTIWTVKACLLIMYGRLTSVAPAMPSPWGA